MIYYDDYTNHSYKHHLQELLTQMAHNQMRIMVEAGLEYEL